MGGPRRNRKGTLPREERWRGVVCTERGEGRQQKYHFQTYLLEGYFFMASLFFCRVYQEKNMNRPQKSNGRPTKEQERHSAT